MATVVFFGTPVFAVPSLTLLLSEEHTVAAVVTQPDRSRGRGRKPGFSPVKSVSLAAGVPVIQPESCRDSSFVNQIASFAPDLLIVVAYGQILPESLLAIPKIFPINLHASLLPRWRGAAPVSHAILAGDRTTGVTTMIIRPRLDSGEILLMAEEQIHTDDTTASLSSRLALLGANLLKKTIAGLARGDIIPILQDESTITYAPSLKKEDARLDWTEPAEIIDRKVRAFFPWPKAFSFRGQTRITVLAGRPEPGVKASPGELTAADPKGDLVIACGREGYRITRIQPENRAPLDSGEFIRGYRPHVGERWGGKFDERVE